MNDTLQRQILAQIEAHDTIILSRHTRPDGDAVGSSMGLAAILRATYPAKRVFVDSEDYSDYMAFLGDEGPHPTDEDYAHALVIVLDTGNVRRISNHRYAMGDTLVKIDHHIPDEPYGDIAWIEEEAPSCCELVVHLWMDHRDVLRSTPYAATCLYAGMVTDTGRFRFCGVGSDTFLCAAALLQQGIDLDTLYAHLYLDDYSVILARASLTAQIQRTPHGVAWLYLDQQQQAHYGLSREDASNTVSLMEKIKGSLVWLAFIENPDGSVRVRLRSRFVEVQPLAARYHGGGHACASGATVYSTEERMALIEEADRLVADYMATHHDWL